MDFQTINHKGLSALIKEDDDSNIPSDLRKRIRYIVTALASAKHPKAIEGPPGWRIHILTGDRAGTISISASGNWRITFDVKDNQIYNLDLEDYH